MGDEKKYLVALVTLDAEKTSHLNPRLIKERLAKHLHEINKSRANDQRIKRIGIVEGDFTVANGLLSHTLKMKRHTIQKSYRVHIEKLYHLEKKVVFMRDFED